MPSVCHTGGLLDRRSGGGHYAGQSVRPFCGEKSDFCDGAWHVGTRLHFPVALEKLWAVRQLGEGIAEGLSQIESTVTR